MVDGVALTCLACGTHLSAALLSCPRCHQLTHAVELKEIAKEASEAARDGDFSRELAKWRQALEFLPSGTTQHQSILTKVMELSRKVDSGAIAILKPSASPHNESQRSAVLPKWLVRLGPIGLLIWKFKAILVFLATKGKLLLLGLTKASTLFSMLLSLGVYWAAWGWKFAFGLVVSMYVHEMGHVTMLTRYGIKATAPMFIPGLGAVVRLKQYPVDAREDARVGLAGPLWGLGAALVAYAVFLMTGWASWAAIARVGAWINLFNLLPVWQLDGGRGFRALSRGQRWIVALIIGAMWFFTSEGLLALLLFLAVIRAFGKEAPTDPDRIALVQFIALIIILSAMCVIRVPGIAR